MRTAYGVGTIALEQLSDGDRNYIQYIRFFDSKQSSDELTSEDPELTPEDKALVLELAEWSAGYTEELSIEDLENTLTVMGFKYEFSDNGVVITKYTGSADILRSHTV